MKPDFFLEFDVNFDQLNCVPSQPYYMNGCSNATLHCKNYYKDTATNVTSLLEDREILTEGHQYFVENVFKTGEVSIRFDMVGNTIDSPQFKLKLDNLTYLEYDFPKSQAYDNRARITENELGNYSYNNSGTQIYQNNKIKLADGAKNYYLVDRPSQTISYNSFKCPIEINEGGKERINFGYNAMQERAVMYYGNTNANKLLRPFRKFYSADGSMEIKYTLAAAATATSPATPASYEFVTYLAGDAYSAPAVIKSDGLTQNIFYLHRDQQNTILAVSNGAGTVIEKRLFDPIARICHNRQSFNNLGG